MTKIATIRKDGFITSRPWTIDLIVDGTLWKSWGYGFKTKKAALAYCESVGVEVAA